MSIYILTVLRRSGDRIYGAYSTKEQAEEVATNLQHKYKSMQLDFYDFSGWRITQCELDSAAENVEVVGRYYRG